VTNGILGSFGFDRNGDMTANLMPIFRIPLSGRPPTLDINHPPPLYTEISVGG
jgi:hypothetical protein